MPFGPSTLNEAIRQSEPDAGFWTDLGIGIKDLMGHTGLDCTLTTTPKRVLGSDDLYIQWDAGVSVAAYLVVPLPRTLAKRQKLSYGIAYAQLRLHLALRSAGATNSPAMTVTAKARAKNGALKATFTAVFRPDPSGAAPTTNAVSTQTNPLEYVYTFEELAGTGPTYIEPGDKLVITITPAAHAADALELHDLHISCTQNAGFTDRTKRV